MPLRQEADTLSPRESFIYDYEREENVRARQFTLALEDKKLANLRQEAKLNALLRLPALIIKLPVLILFGIAYIVSMFTKKDLPPEFWQLMR